jgi:hypothetical protein
MYRGFNINYDSENSAYYKEGLSLYQDYEKYVKKRLTKYINKDNSLNGSDMQEEWFPQIHADIFISHSHTDKDKAITLAGWLSTMFGIQAFIDSCIWGYADDLLKIIDDEYCVQDNGLYNYKQRNYSTSHVHMMLSTALLKMIDKTECLFFLNTPNSVSTSEIVDQTESPWIYSEIVMTQLVRKNIPPRRETKDRQDFIKGIGLDEKLRIRYTISLGHLTNLGSNSLTKWGDRWVNDHISNPYQNADEALDGLYKLYPVQINTLHS